MKLQKLTIILLTNLLTTGTALSGYLFNESFENDGFRNKEKFQVEWASTYDPKGVQGQLLNKTYKDMFNARYDSRIVGIEEVIDGNKVIHPTRNGNFAFRQEIFFKKNYLNQNNGTHIKPRAGFGPYILSNADGDGNLLPGQEFFLGGSVFIPKDFVDDASAIHTDLIQLHRKNDPSLPNYATSGSQKTTNITGLGIEAGKLMFFVQRIVKKSDGKYYVDAQEKSLAFGGGKVNKGEWIDWIIHVKLCDKTCGTAGFTRLYINNEKVFDVSGQNLIEDSTNKGAHITYDLYNYAWVCQGEDRTDPLKCYNNQTGTKNSGSRFVYHDELKIYQVTSTTERDNGIAAVTPTRKSRASTVQNLNYNAGYTSYLENKVGSYYCKRAGKSLPLPYAHFDNDIRFSYAFSGTMTPFSGTTTSTTTTTTTTTTTPTTPTTTTTTTNTSSITGDTAQSHIELSGNVLTITATGQGSYHQLAGTLVFNKAIGSSKIIEKYSLAAEEVPDLSGTNVDIFFSVGKDYTNYIKLDVTGLTDIKFTFDQAVTDLDTAAFNNKPLTSTQKSTGVLIIRDSSSTTTTTTSTTTSSSSTYFNAFMNTSNEFVLKIAGKLSSDQVVARGEIQLASSITSSQIVPKVLGTSADGLYNGYARLKSGSGGKIVEYRLYSAGTNTSSFRITNSPDATVNHSVLTLNGKSILDQVASQSSSTNSEEFIYFKNFLNSSKEYVVKLAGQDASDELVAKGTISLSTGISSNQLADNGLGSSPDGKYDGYLRLKSGTSGKVVEYRIYASGADVSGFKITNSPSATLDLQTLNLNGDAIDKTGNLQ